MKFPFFFKSARDKEAEEEEYYEDELEEADEQMDEVAAAIGLALHMHTTHLMQYEQTVVTIQKVIKPYSPWSSKIYGLRQRPPFVHRPNRLK